MSTDTRLGLLQVFRCADYLMFLGMLHGTSQTDSKSRQELEEVAYLFGWGLNEAVSILWQSEVPPGVPMVPSQKPLEDWANSFVQCCGRVRILEHMLELERLKLAEMSTSACGAIKFNLDCPGIGSEAMEREDANFVSELQDRVNDQAGVFQELKARKPAIRDRMRRLVSPWQRYFIQYGAEPDVDDYYSDLAAAVAPTKSGWDAFPLEATFGGIPFVDYIRCVRAWVGIAFKHLDFCLLLQEKHPEISLIDTLTIPRKLDETARDLSYALGISEEKSAQVLATTVLNPENANYHLQTPAGAPALHYWVADGSIVRLLRGCLDNPFEFMLRELRRRYRADWDRAVDEREHLFRRDLIAALSVFNRIVVFGDNIRISCDIGITDIDAFAFDPVTSVASFFQLKWQDAFGSSMRERESRKSNFLKTGNSWVEKVCRWIEEGKMPQTLISTGFPKELARNIKETRVFVLGRSFSHFSGESTMDVRAAWGTWPQLLRLLEAKGIAMSPLAALYDLLKADSPHLAIPGQVSEEEMRVGDMRVVIRAPGRRVRTAPKAEDI